QAFPAASIGGGTGRFWAGKYACTARSALRRVKNSRIGSVTAVRKDIVRRFRTFLPRYNRICLSDDTDIRARERVGTSLNDKWTLERLLGIGGMAAVYAARHRNGARAAIKVLHQGLSRHAE